MMRRCALLLGLLTAFGWAQAAQTPAQRQRIFAQLPDWTGVWISNDGIWNQTGLRNDIGDQKRSLLIFTDLPLTPEGQRRQAADRAKMAKQQVKECGFPFPFVMEGPWPFELLVTPEQTVLIAAGREVRHIYTDARGHMPPDMIWSTPWGDSTGHWEGATLVVETIAVEDPLALASPSSRFIERIRRVDENHLEDQLTMYDPVLLTHPFKVTLPFKRLTNVDRIVHGDCTQNDRNPIVNGQDSVTPAN
jgi:hypothetical protein